MKPSFEREVGKVLRLEVRDHDHSVEDLRDTVTFVIIPFNVRAIIPKKMFLEFAIAVADVLAHLRKH